MQVLQRVRSLFYQTGEVNLSLEIEDLRCVEISLILELAIELVEQQILSVKISINR